MTRNKQTRVERSILLTTASEAIANKRIKAKDGLINRMCGKNSVFSDDFKRLILENYEGILDHVYLATELKGARDVITALKRAADDPRCADLLNRMQSYPALRSKPNLLCPVWRYEHSIIMSYFATQRYIFPEVKEELYLLTIIHDFASNLETLEEQICSARKSLDSVIKTMNKNRRGVMMLGAFEPDLRSHKEMTKKPDLVKAAVDLQWQSTECGGWVLSSHFIVRVPHDEDFLAFLKKEFPAKGWGRVQLKPIKESDVLADTVTTILRYMGKYKEPLFKVPTRGKKRETADKEMHQLRNAFMGPSARESYGKSVQFDLHAARRQWALFIDSLGEDTLFYSVESVHAQKWQSQSEMQFLTQFGSSEEVHGFERIEIHRDTGPYSRYTIDPAKKRFVKRRRTRKLQYDPEWMDQTDYSGYDGDSQVVHKYL